MQNIWSSPEDMNQKISF